MSAESARKQGTSDAAQNKGAQTQFTSSQEREAYNAAYNQAKKGGK